MQTYYVVEGPVRLSPGQEVALTAAQIAPRAHTVTLAGDMPKGEQRVMVTADVALEFKTGEIVGLADVPRALAANLEKTGRAGGANKAEAKAKADAEAEAKAKAEAEAKAKA